MRHDRWGETGLRRDRASRDRRGGSWARIIASVVCCAVLINLVRAQDAPDEPAAAAPAIQEPGSDAEAGPPLNRRAVVIKQAFPEYPQEFAGSGLDAEVVVNLLVDRMGRASHIRVEGSPDPAFTQAAMDAVAQYKFLPAIKNGRITNDRLRLLIQVGEDFGDRSLVDYPGGRIELLATSTAEPVDTPVRRVFGPRPAYPLEMLAAGKPGEVIVEFTVSEDGIPLQPTVQESTFVEFAHAVQGAVMLWRYSPAMAGVRPVRSALRYRISFQADEIAEETRMMAGRLLAGDHSDVVSQRQIDRQPKLRTSMYPTFGGGEESRVNRAELIFMVDAKGAVRLPRIVRASDPVSGYAALAAVGTWTFEPALRKKQPVPVLVTMPLKF